MEQIDVDVAGERAVQRAKWVHERLRELLAARPDPADFRLSTLWPALIDWFAAPAPDLGNGSDDLAIEVAFQTGRDDDDFPLDPPEGLAPDAQWFNVAFVRTPSVWAGDDSNVQVSAGIELWVAPAPPLLAFLDDPRWDTGNLLGYDCLGDAGPGAREWCAQPTVAHIIAGFGDLVPAAVLLLSRDEDLRLA